jgi:hypothetical protein
MAPLAAQTFRGVAVYEGLDSVTIIPIARFLGINLVPNHMIRLDCRPEIVQVLPLASAL